MWLGIGNSACVLAQFLILSRMEQKDLFSLLKIITETFTSLQVA